MARKRTGSRERGWWRKYFEDHPLHGIDNAVAKHGDKDRVICKRCLDQIILRARQQDQALVDAGTLTALREPSAIAAQCK